MTSTTKPPTGDSASSSRNLIIALVTSITGAIILVTAITVVIIRRRRRIPFLNRGISPIDDEEIESWKISKHANIEKDIVPPGSSAATMVNSHHDPQDSPKTPEADVFPVISSPPSALVLPHVTRKKTSASSLVNTLPSIPQEPATPPSQSFLASASMGSSFSTKKPPSVIIYTHPITDIATSPHNSEPSPRSKKSLECRPMTPQTPIQARAPNSRPGLTDETVQGEVPYLPSPKRTTTRIRGHSHTISSSSSHPHTRAGSSFSFSGGGPGWKEQWTAYNEESARTGSKGRDSSNPFQQHQSNSSNGSSNGLISNASTPTLSHSQSLGNVKGTAVSARAKAMGHARLHSDVSMSPSFPMEEEIALGGLSPRPAGKGKQDIGLALG